MADDLFDPVDYATLYGGLGSPGSAAAANADYPADTTGGAAETPPAAPPAPPGASQPPGGFLSSILPSWLGGTSGEPPARSALPPAAGGIGGLGSNTMVGLGLGLLGGNRLDPYGRAIAGYQAGARTDLAARQAEEAALYRQQQIGLRKQGLGLQAQQLAQAREIAFKPQIHFQTQEDPNTGYHTTRAFLFNPATSAMQEMPLNAADKIADQGKVGVSMTNPIDGSTFTCLPGMNCREIRNEFSRMAVKVQTGEMSAPQAQATLSASQMAPAGAALAKDNLDAQGLDARGRVLEAIGRSSEAAGIAAGKLQGSYAEFADKKNNWITAYMMRRGMSTGNEAQRREIDRTFFPQPEQKTKDQTANQAIVEQKRAARAEAEKEIRAAAGPFYRGGGAGGSGGAPVRVSSPEEARRLPSRTRIILPDGSIGRVP